MRRVARWWKSVALRPAYLVMRQVEFLLEVFIVAHDAVHRQRLDRDRFMARRRARPHRFGGPGGSGRMS